MATRLSKRRSMDGSVPSTPPSSGKGKRRDAPSDYRGDVSRAPDSDAAARGSSGVAHLEPADETMRDRSPSESRSVSSDDADAREDVAAVANEAAVDRKVRVPFGHATSPRSIDVSRRKTKTRVVRCFPRRERRNARAIRSSGVFLILTVILLDASHLFAADPLPARTKRKKKPNQRTQRRDDEEASVAFARLLQEQERAFYERRVANAETPRREYGGDDDETDCAYDAAAAAADDDVLDANDPRSSLGGSPEDVFRVENATDTDNTVPGSGESDEDASLALARSLMEEEQREWRNRMFALAGVGDPDDEADEGVDVDGMTYEELTELGEHIGTQSKGVSKEAMATLKRFAYGDDCGTRAEKQKEDDDDDECCAVCRLGFEFGDPCLGLPQCGHAYHAECLEPWLAENKSCPLCKTEIEGEAEAAA